MIELPDSVHDLVARERQLLTDLLVLLGKLEAEPRDVDDVRTALEEAGVQVLDFNFEFGGLRVWNSWNGARVVD